MIQGQLPRLRVRSVDDINQGESEVSWISQGDCSPVLAAFPNLRHLGIRGGDGLNFGRLRLPKLDALTIQTGGLGADVVRQVASASRPVLEHLELSLGTEEYAPPARWRT